jgi:hypothetical protein
VKTWRHSIFLMVLCFCLGAVAHAGSATFDFDNCNPVLHAGIGTPLDQTCSGVTAHFSSPYDGYQGGGYSVQNHDTTFWNLHLFYGNYLMPNGLNPGALDIRFNQSLYSIGFDFATADFNQNEVPTTIQMDAYFNSTLVGSTQAHGAYGYPGDTMPMGSLLFDSGGKAFNSIEIWIPYQPLGTSDFLVDNIKVNTRGGGGTTPEPGALALLGTGVLAAVPSIRRRFHH